MSELNLLEFFLYIVTGSFAGFAAGLLGIGGGLIIVPVLYYIFSTHGVAASGNTTQGFEEQYLMHMALATSLATIIITSTSSTLAHHKKRAVLWPVVALLTPGICLGAWFGASFAAQLDTSILKPLFGVFELFVAILMLSQYQSKQHQLTIKPINGLLGGGLIGGISAIVGIGGGTLTVPFLHWHKIQIKNAIATSAACGLPIAVFGTVSYIFSGWEIMNAMQVGQPDQFGNGNGLTFGFVQPTAFFFIAVSSFLFAPLGAKFTHKISDVLLKRVFALLLLLLGLNMLL